MKNIVFYFCLFVLMVFGMMFFDYAFPNLSTQQSVAAALSIYCFSFATVSFMYYEVKRDKEINDKLNNK